MNDMRAVITPKSDQLNSDDLIAGPLTIKIESVTIRPGTEQPVSIFFVGDGGKPWKPCKSMARVMVQCWGPDANEYVGRSLTLYRDPSVKWGGMEVGGIRVSHMTNLKQAMTMALTATKGSRKPFVVKPLEVAGGTGGAKKGLAAWIADTLRPNTESCDADGLAALQKGKAYLAAVERGTDEEKRQIAELIAAATARLASGDDEHEGGVDDDDAGGDDA